MSYLVTIIGGYGLGNLGDDALMSTAIEAVRGKVDDSRICVKAAVNTGYLRRHFPDIRFVSREFSGLIETKVLLYGGGTQFYSFPGVSGDTMHRVRKYLFDPDELWRAVKRRLAVCTIEQEHTAAISVGIGPFVGNCPREARARDILKSCQWICNTIDFQ